MNERWIPLVLGFWLLAGRVGAQQYDLRVFGVEDGLPGSTIHNIAQDSAGYLWVDTDGGLCRFDGRTFRAWPAELGAPPAELHPEREDERAVWHLPPPRRSAMPNGTGVRHGSTSCTLVDRTGRSWRGTAHGLEEFPDTQGSKPTRIIDRKSGLGGDAINCLYQDASGVIWIGTEQGGLGRYMSDAVTHYGLSGGPLGRTRAMVRSPDGGTIVAGGPDGIAVLRKDRAGYESTAHPAVNALAMLDDHRVIAGTDSGAMILRIDEALPQEIERTGARFASVRVNTALRTSAGTCWLGSDNGVTSAGGAHDGLRIGRDTLACTALAEFNDSILIGTHRGLFAAPLDNSAANWTPVIRAGDEDISALVVDLAGNIWIGTAASGLIRYHEGSIQRWTERDGLAGDRVRQLLLDAYQNLWAGTDRGFNLLELDELQERVINIRTYGLDDGFPGIEAMPGACLLDRDSALWFGTTRGTIRFDPQRILEDPVAPRTRITDLTLFFEHPDWKPWCDSLSKEGLPIGLRLPYHRNHLTFRFTGLSLAYPERVRFQYKLEGRDAEWSPITQEDRITYSGLEPGEYTFLVKARNGSGIWNDSPARFDLVITPPFWQTGTFRIGGIIAVLLAFYGFERLRDRRSRKARERLERMVDERTRELADEKHRSDTLLLNILPETTAAELKENGTAQARSYAECTVLFSDFQGFTTLSEQFEATGIVTELDRFFRAFDRITDKYGTEKIKTIGDAYMCASGVPEPSPTHALDAVLMALEMLSVVDGINALRLADGHPAWPIRIGLNSGPLIAGVVGEKKFAYDVWGDTVNLASRMESNGAPGRVNVTGTTYRLVEHYVVAESRGRMPIKGKGEIESWFIDRLRPEYSADPSGRSGNEALLAERDRLRAVISSAR